MANEFEKRHTYRRPPGKVYDSSKTIVIGRLKGNDETVAVDISKVKDTSHKIYKNKIEEAIAIAKKNLKE